MGSDKITINDFKRKKEEKERISAITAYDRITAELVSKAGMDLILVGDSLGNVILGYETTIPVTLEEMIHHTKAVMSGVEGSFTCIDMPFMTYQGDLDEAISNCGRAIKETGVESVKIEGNYPELIERLSRIGIPVLGHIGFVPQSFHKFGGYRIVGKDAESAVELLNDAREIECAGAYAIVLECVPQEVAEIITQSLSIPTIGIGAGSKCDGQIVVFHDIMGLFKPTPKHARVYAEVGEVMGDALREYIEDVNSGEFPGDVNTYHMNDEEYERFKREVED